MTQQKAIADTMMQSGYTFQQEQLLHALENEVKTGMLMCNPRVTGFTSFAKAVLNFINDKKAPRTKKNLYTYLVANGYYRDLHSYTWSDR
jgi:DNA polymerase III gamma/tau subunit